MKTDRAQFGVADYLRTIEPASRKALNSEVIRKVVGSRVGLLGNPSDGFGGKTIAAMVEDFWAVVRPPMELIFNAFMINELLEGD